MLEFIRLELDKQDITFSKTVAAKIVGGEYNLERLVNQGKIRMDKPSAKQNGRWYCKGSDVIKFIKFNR